MAKIQNYHFTVKLSAFFLALSILSFFAADSTFPAVVPLKVIVYTGSLLLSFFSAVVFFILKCFHPHIRGTKLAVACFSAIVLLVLGAFLAAHGINQQFHIPMYKKAKCRENMKQIYQALLGYADVNGGMLPLSENWCQVLLDGKYIQPEELICPAVQEAHGKSNYVLNTMFAGKKIEELPARSFLLYEDICCWNRAESEIIINGINHTIVRMEYVNILFVNGRTESYHKERLGEIRDSGNLRLLTP